MGFQLGNAWNDFKIQDQVCKRAEPGNFGPGARHVQDGASLDRGAGPDRSFVFCRGNHRHVQQPVSPSVPHIFDRSQDTGENLAAP